MNTLLIVAEQAFTAIALMFYSGGPLNVILSGGLSQGDKQIAEPDYAITRYLFLITYIILLVLLAVRWKKGVYVLSRDRSIWAIVGFAVLSLFWSDAPDRTISAGIALIGTTLFGLYLATRYSPKQQLQILGWAFALIIGLSLIYALALPKYGIMGGVHAGAWRGIYTHKNTFGKIMTLSSVIFLLLILRDQKNRLFLGLGLSLSILLLLLSASKAALVNLLTMVLITIVCQVFRLQYHLLIVLLGSVVLISGTVTVWVASHLELIVVDMLGKDLTLTGRTDLWMSVMEMVQRRPWLGYGYQAFWRGWESAAAYVWRAEAWPAPDAHNGFLDLALQLGLVGVAIFLIGYLINMAKSLVQLRTTVGIEFVWPVLYLVYMILSNLAETSLLKRNDIFWIFYVMVSFTMLMPIESNSQSSKPQKVFPSLDFNTPGLAQDD